MSLAVISSLFGEEKAKDAYEPFAGIARNPTIELPFKVEEIVKGVECVVVTHDHPDHFDKAAGSALPKVTPVFCQPKEINHGFNQYFPKQFRHPEKHVRTSSGAHPL